MRFQLSLASRRCCLNGCGVRHFWRAQVEDSKFALIESRRCNVDTGVNSDIMTFIAQIFDVCGDFV